ncbi:uncharacterized protein [Palaemon carinicauda]|uniref:uncharacterized protein n=1 Tax=Palaemon carinicauda TaxID=392227 RepID=UPI0035B59CC3
MYLISTVICLLFLVSDATFDRDRPKSYINLPLVHVYKASAKDISMEEFIDNSYQPVMITAALDKKTVRNLSPWSFARLHASLEAATTFCAVATDGGKIVEENVGGKLGKKEGEKLEVKEEEALEEKEGETLEKKEGEKLDENEGEKLEKKEGETLENKGETLENKGEKLEENKGDKLEKNENQKGETIVNDEKKSKQNRGKDVHANKEKERKKYEQMKETHNEVKEESWEIVEVSLRRFGLEANKFSGEAFVNVTKDFGKLLRLPEFLEWFDFDAVIRAGLHYTRRGWLSQIDRRSRSFHSASVVCILEGHVSVYLTPFPVQWEYMTCQEDTCTLRVGKSTPDEMHEDLFLVRAELDQRDCLFLPLEWIWQASSSVDSIALRMIWEDDLTIRDDVVDSILSEGEMKHDIHEESELSEDMESNKTYRKKNMRRRPSRTIWEVLPQGLRRSSPVLWSSENPLLHLVRFYLLSSQRRDATEFLHDFIYDRIILPNLVDCPPECQTAASNIFILLDANSDGILSEEDAMHLTRDTFDALSSELDDLMDELREFGVEQWESVAKAGGDSNFMQRAKDRMVEGVKVSMRRWVAGDMDEQEERNLKENNPGLYEDILAARKTKASADVMEGKDEL